MGIEEDREAIADLKARMNTLEREVDEIKQEQKESRDKAEQAALREKDLGKQMDLLSKDIEEHIKLHSAQKESKVRAIDVIIALGMLLTSALSAYGAIAMITISKAVTK